MIKILVSFLQFGLFSSMITIFGMLIFDVQMPQRAIFLFWTSICSLGFLWFLAQFLLDLRQYSRDKWNFGERKPRVTLQWGTEGHGPDMYPQAMMWFGYPFATSMLLLFSFAFGVIFSRAY
jgi:hypothetical protein